MALTVPYRSLLSAQDRALLSQALYIDSRLDQVSLLAQLRSRPAGRKHQKHRHSGRCTPSLVSTFEVWLRPCAALQVKMLHLNG